MPGSLDLRQVVEIYRRPLSRPRRGEGQLRPLLLKEAAMGRELSCDRDRVHVPSGAQELQALVGAVVGTGMAAEGASRAPARRPQSFRKQEERAFSRFPCPRTCAPAAPPGST